MRSTLRVSTKIRLTYSRFQCNDSPQLLSYMLKLLLLDLNPLAGLKSSLEAEACDDFVQCPRLLGPIFEVPQAVQTQQVFRIPWAAEQMKDPLELVAVVVEVRWFRTFASVVYLAHQRTLTIEHLQSDDPN